jgi:flavin reductase (DIM6/NTAB) family NADH-FMN oxidoreductase RutF
LGDAGRVSVAVKLGRYVCDWLTEGQPFVLNLVAEGQTNLLKHFGKGFEPGAPAFEGLAISHCARGVPILNEALGHFLAKIARGRLVNADQKPMVHIRKSGANY